jgi:uncharacterized small protein (DUF1192 family)
MAAFLNALREEGTKADCLQMLEKMWTDELALRARVAELEAQVAALNTENERLTAPLGDQEGRLVEELRMDANTFGDHGPDGTFEAAADLIERQAAALAGLADAECKQRTENAALKCELANLRRDVVAMIGTKGARVDQQGAKP